MFYSKNVMQKRKIKNLNANLSSVCLIVSSGGGIVHGRLSVLGSVLSVTVNRHDILLQQQYHQTHTHAQQMRRVNRFCNTKKTTQQII